MVGPGGLDRGVVAAALHGPELHPDPGGAPGWRAMRVSAPATSSSRSRRCPVSSRSPLHPPLRAHTSSVCRADGRGVGRTAHFPVVADHLVASPCTCNTETGPVGAHARVGRHLTGDAHHRGHRRRQSHPAGGPCGRRPTRRPRGCGGGRPRAGAHLGDDRPQVRHVQGGKWIGLKFQARLPAPPASPRAPRPGTLPAPPAPPNP